MFYEMKNEKLSFVKSGILWEKLHCHNEMEIVIPISGEATAYVNAKRVEIAPNDLLVVFPNQIHSYFVNKKGDFGVAIFPTDYIPKLNQYIYNQTSGLKLNYSNKHRIKSIISDLCDNNSADERFFDTRLIGYINLLMSEIMPYVDVIKERIDNDFFQLLFDYCSNNFQKNIGLDAIAEEIGVSKWKITRSLKSTTGLSLPEFINFLRISNACELLRNTKFSITQIYNDVGFDSQRNFNRMFYRFMNKTPSEYRNENG